MTTAKPKMTARAPRKAPAANGPVKPIAEKGPVDPIEILEAIASNRRLKPTPRVAAAKALLAYRMAAMSAQSPAKAEEPSKPTKADRVGADINRQALALMSATRGRA